MNRSPFLLLKSFFVVIFFFILFFIQAPLTLAAPTDTTKDEKKTDPWEEMWDAISNFFQNLFGIQSYEAKDYDPVTSETTFGFTDYNKDNKDIAIRAASEENKIINKGIFLDDILNHRGKLENRTLAYVCNNSCSSTKINDECYDIKATTLPHYYYNKGVKILYRPGSPNPINYDPDLFDPKEVIINDDACYTNLYETFTPVPQGNFQNKANAAAASSTQLNRYLRTPIPAASAGEDIPLDNYTPANAKQIVKDNDKQEGIMLQNFIPDVSQSADGGIATNRKKARNMFADYLHPLSWQKDKLETAPERQGDDTNQGNISDSANGTSGTYTGTCNGVSSHCRGMSQYGAYGMALSGKSYQEILSFYYGNVQIKNISSIQSSSGTLDSNPQVQIKIDEEGDVCSDGDSIALESYLTGLGEMPDYWGKLGFEALKAQVVAARTYAMMRTNYFSKPICNSSKCQVFRCSNLGQKPNLARAVRETAGQVLVDAATQKSFSTEYARSFCGPSREVVYPNIHTNPSVDGFNFEKEANDGEPPYCKSTSI